jgi:hypothetical protein
LIQNEIEVTVSPHKEIQVTVPRNLGFGGGSTQKAGRIHAGAEFQLDFAGCVRPPVTSSGIRSAFHGSCLPSLWFLGRYLVFQDTSVRSGKRSSRGRVFLACQGFSTNCRLRRAWSTRFTSPPLEWVGFFWNTLSLRNEIAEWQQKRDGESISLMSTFSKKAESNGKIKSTPFPAEL